MVRNELHHKDFILAHYKKRSGKDMDWYLWWRREKLEELKCDPFPTWFPEFHLREGVGFDGWISKSPSRVLERERETVLRRIDEKLNPLGGWRVKAPILGTSAYFRGTSAEQNFRVFSWNFRIPELPRKRAELSLGAGILEICWDKDFENCNMR